jgi:hypothetical protein
MSQLTRTTLLLLGLAALLLVFPALADDEKKPAAGEGYDPAAMEEAWNKARMPGENHQFLAGMEGEWTYTSTMWMNPSQPPMESSGESTKTMIMGGRYLQEETTGEFQGEPFNGRGVTAYDNNTGEFVSTWIDNMGTGVMVSRGQRDGDELTLRGEFLDPMSRQMMKLKTVTRVVDKDKHVFEYYMTIPEMGEVKQMEIVYVRKGGE